MSGALSMGMGNFSAKKLTKPDPVDFGLYADAQRNPAGADALADQQGGTAEASRAADRDRRELP